MKRTVTILLSGILLLVGCSRQQTEYCPAPQEDISFKVVSTPAGGKPDRRSVYASGLQETITDYTIIVFDSNGNNVSVNYYQGNANMSGRALFVNEALNTTLNDSFDVFIIANLGDLSTDANLCSGGVPVLSKVRDYTYDYTSNFQEFNSKGFPMAGFYGGYRPDSDSRTLYADRLVTQYDISFIKSARNPNSYTITGGRLCNVAGRCTPFKPFRADSQNDVHDSGDEFSSSDISALNAGGSATLYVPENEQGDVFPYSVNSESMRKMENLPSGSVFSNTCTFAEFYVTVCTPTATYENVTYRYYFGDGLRDCNVHRNMVYTLTMNFDNVFVEDEGWRIEPGTPVIDDNAITVSRSQLSIIKGMSNTVSVTRKPGVEYEMYYSQAEASNYGLTVSKTTTGNVDTYTISTSYTPASSGTTVPKVDYADIPVTFTTADGLVSKVFNIRVNKNPLLVEFSFPDGLGSADVAQTVDWPSGTTFETSVTGILYGESQYCSNRILGRYNCDIWQAFLDVYSASEALSEGDAASTEFQTMDLRTGELQIAAHELNKSHPVDHHYAVGSTQVHYTAVGHAYLKVYYAVRINGSVASVPVKVIAKSSSSGAGSTYRVDDDGSSTVLTVRAQRVPAWYYDQSVTNNNAADSYSGGYETTNVEYPVSLMNYVIISNGIPKKYIKGDLYGFNVEGGPMDSYSPPMGMELIYGLPDFVSY